MSQDPTHQRFGASKINPYGIRTSPFYSSVAHSNGPCTIITVAGQIGARPDGTVPTDPVEQYKQAFENLKRCLEAAGAHVQDILKLTYYIVDHDSEKPCHRPALMEFLGGHRPASTLIPVEKLAAPEFLFEIEATAAIPQNATENFDVVVVGAGLSGLQAAVDLHKAGVKVKVLEARDRVGGKTWSRVAQGSVCDVGAAWINDTNQSKMYALAQKYGLELITQNTDGSIVCDEGIGSHKTHPYGQLLSNETDEAQIEDIIRIRDILEATCQQIDITDPVASCEKLRKDLDDITFEQWLHSHKAGEHAMNAMKVGTRAMLGVEPSELSAAYFLGYCKSGGGKGLAAELPADTIVLMSPVRRIEQGEGGVRIISARGVFEASKVVISVPTPLYQEITFSPPLPVEKLELSRSAKLGDYCKSIVFYQNPWWRKHGLTGMSQSAHGPCGVTRDSSVDADNHYSLTCFIVGQPARDWMMMPDKGRRKAVVGHLQQLFGKFADVQKPIHIEEQIWRNEQWSQGCPCPVLGPGGLTKFEMVLRAPAGRLHFVGTETAYEWKGYMEGAVRSGERGARGILLSLNGAKF